MKGVYNLARSFSGRHIWDVTSSVFVILILVLAIALVSTRLAGFQIFTIMSGSMEPDYPVGSLAYIKPVDTSTLTQGDVITFINGPNSVVTHRIVEVIHESDATGVEVLKFRTQGDANNSPDGSLVHYQNVIGTPSFIIPLLGYVSWFLQRPPGIYFAIIAGTFLISLIIIPYVAKPRGKEPAVRQTKSQS